jgi:hypothetical protein
MHFGIPDGGLAPPSYLSWRRLRGCAAGAHAKRANAAIFAPQKLSARRTGRRDTTRRTAGRTAHRGTAAAARSHPVECFPPVSLTAAAINHAG